MDDNAADTAGLWQTHVDPCLARIGRFIDSIAHHVAVTDYPSFASSRPYRARVGPRDCQSADGGDGLLLKDWPPAISAVRRFPNPSGRRSCVVHAGISRYAGHGGNTVANLWTYEAESKLTFLFGVWLLRSCRNHAAQDRN